MRAVLRTIVACVALLALTVIVFIFSGVYDVAAVHPDNPFAARIIRTISDHSIAAQLDKILVPAGFDAPDKIAAGGKLYGQTCVICHGGPGLKAGAIAEGLNPSPPNLFRSGRQTDPKETYWFVDNGVKMTGMPGFSKSMTDDEIWSLVAFLGKAPGMSASDFASGTGAGATPPSAPAVSPPAAVPATPTT